MISQTIEDYLKAIYKLQKTEGKVFTLAVAERIGVSAASVTVMLKKLAKMNLLKHTPYQGAILTEKGERIALNVIRRHRLSELFLNEFAGLSWDKVDAEAEKLEHVISEELADRIEEVLGYPKTDPHGDPIPTKGGGLEEVFYESLVDSEVGQTVIIRRVSDNSSEILRYIASLGMHPGTIIHLRKKGPFRGPLFIQVGSDEHIISQEVASKIFVAPLKDDT